MDDRLPFMSSHDPIAKFLLKLSKGNSIRVGIVAVLAYGILVVGVGAWVYFHHEQMGYPVVKFFDLGQLIYSLYGYLIAAPIAWVFYIRSAFEIPETLHGLLRNGVIGASKPGFRSSDDLKAWLEQENRNYDKKVYTFIIMALTTGFFVGWLIELIKPLTTPPFNWWFVNPLFFILIWLPLMWMGLYAVLWLIFRRIVGVLILNKIFRTYDIEPKLFHPDNVNGFSPVGDYALEMSTPIFVAGIWLASNTLYPVLAFHTVILPDMYVLIGLYVFSIPLTLLLPIFRPHLAMRNSKMRLLEATAEDIRKYLALTDELGSTRSMSDQEKPFDPPNLFNGIMMKIIHHRISDQSNDANTALKMLTDSMSGVEILEKKYQLLDREHHTWPLDLRSVGRFVTTTAAPFLTVLLTVFLEKYL